MKNRIIKQLMAYALVGAMIISTPMTASATETSITDIYTQTEDSDGSGTLSGSVTGTHKYEEEINDPNKEIQIMGLALDKESLSLEKDDVDRLQARVLYNNYDPKDEVMVLAADQETKEIIDKYLRWEVIDTEGNEVVKLSYYDKLTEKGEIQKDENGKALKDYSMVNVLAKNGGQATVMAYIDKNANREKDDDEYFDTAVVTVKEYATSLTLADLSKEKFYVRNTYDLKPYATLTPATAKENISFYFKSTESKKDAKSIIIDDNGFMTIKKIPQGTITLYATTESGLISEGRKLTCDAGVPAKKVEVKLDKGTNVLDHHSNDEKSGTLTATLTGDGSVTDQVTWSTKQTKIVSLAEKTVENKDGKATTVVTVTPTGVGKATIIAKAASGRQGKITIEVKSTPEEVRIAGGDSITTYTGKKLQLVAEPLSKEKTVIPAGKTKFTFSYEKNNKVNKKNIRVTGKGLVTSPNLLVGATKNDVNPDFDETKVDVTAKFNGNKTVTSAKTTIKVEQVDIDDIAVTNVTTKKAISFNNKKQATDTGIYVGNTSYKYDAVVASSNDGEDNPAKTEWNDAISWASSSKKVGTITDNGVFTALKGGTTKLTASYVDVTTKNGKKSAKLIKKTITVKPIQKAQTLTLNKNTFVAISGKTRKVSINVKKQLPSGAKDNITWKKLVADKDGKILESDINVKTGVSTRAPYNKISVDVSNYQANTVVKIGAYADGGAVAYAYIYVVDEATKGVQLVNNSGVKLTNRDLKAVKVGKDNGIAFKAQIKQSSGFVDATNYTKENIAYVKDPVTYSFSKAGIATVKDGKIIGLKPGTTKLTVKTISGKKATLTIKVVE